LAHGVTRILSDLHFRDHGGLRRLETLRPLLDGIENLVLNGDSLESRVPEGAEVLAELRGFFAAAGVPTRYLSGNHDPDISPEADAELASGALWVTHGDIFWDDAAPWSRFAPQFRALIADERRQRRLDPMTSPLAALLAAHRTAHLRGGAHHRPGDRRLRARLAHLGQTLFPPTQVLRMTVAWRQGPELAARWAKRWRPTARFVLFGHIHRPGIWTSPVGDTTVINTGSFGPPFGPWCVDLEANRLRVRRLERRQGQWYPGKVRREFALAKRTLSELSAAP
jgi:predicted phosphodiesterase